MSPLPLDGSPAEVPVFPLGTVLLPGQLLPLQVFEPRYKVLLFDLREEDPAEFVVTLIERGSEVGGGDVRSAVGCLGRIVSMDDTPDGRVIIAVVGTSRVALTEWLPEDPYPRAMARRLSEEPWPGSAADADEVLEGLATSARRVAELAERLGLGAWPGDLELSTDPTMRLWQIALLSPLSTLDRQRLLAIHRVEERAEALGPMLEEQEELLRAQLGWEDEPPGSSPG